MKKSTLTLTFLLFLYVLILGQSKTINNPSYDFKNSGIYNVSKIVLTDTATLLSIHNTFIPRWWVQFNDDEVIRDSDTGKEYKVKGIIGAEMGKKLWMPDSGDSTIVLIFPPLPATVKKIDYQKQVFGIELDESKSSKPKASGVLTEIEKWMKDELAKAPNQCLADFKSADFFNESPARLIGCIKGYDARAGFATGIIYASNIIANDDFPVVVKIEPDGRFYADIPMNMPITSYVVFNVFNDQHIFHYYIEPGQTLCMTLNWDEFLTADRKRNIQYEFKQIEFRGPLAQINHELLAYPSPQVNYKELDKKRKSLAPMDFRADQDKQLQNNLLQLEEYKKGKPLSAKALNILHSNILVENATSLFDYSARRDYYAKQDTANAILKMPIPNEYYNFLKGMDLNDQSMLATDGFGTFINRFEFCDLFKKATSKAYSDGNRTAPKPAKTLQEYFIEEKIELTDEENKFVTLIGKKPLSEDDMAALKQMEDVAKAFNNKHKSHIQTYSNKYITPLNQKKIAELDNWKIEDSVLANVMGLKPSLVYEIAKIRSLKYSFKYAGQREKANALWEGLQPGIKTPYLLSAGNTMLNEAFPEIQVGAVPLPEGLATDIFRKTIAPYKGKVLFVDFWATSCGPCIAGIKRMKETRERYAGNPDFEFVFITDEGSSPENNYNTFVAEQELKNCHRIRKDEFNYLRQLFKFNGIPRYVVIAPNGDVVNDNFSMHNFEFELPKILENIKK
jgi:thiol-disulfide isomerase/thioredoxin